MKIFFLLILSISAMGQFANLSEIDSGSISRVYRLKSLCPGKCMKIPVGYNSRFHKKKEVMKLDLKKPIVSKSQAEECLDKNDCQEKLSAKECTNQGESAIMVLDSNPKEVYCTGTTYKEIGTGSFKIDEDKALKAAWKAEREFKEADEKAIQSALKASSCGKRVKARVLVINAKKGLNKKQRKTILRNFSEIVSLLDSGSLDVARDEIEAVVADGVLVTESDKLKIIAELDRCK